MIQKFCSGTLKSTIYLLFLWLVLRAVVAVSSTMHCTNYTLTNQNCFCDTPNCYFFKDCCNFTRIEDQQLKLPFTCKNLENSKIYIKIINKCPLGGDGGDGCAASSYVQTLTGTRADLIYLTPVYSVSSGRVYDNQFCAKCHGEPVAHLQYAAVYEQNRIELVAAAVRPNSKYKFVIPSNYQRRCTPKRVVSTCDSNTLPLEKKHLIDKCRLSTLYLTYNSEAKFFKSRVCCECNYVQSDYGGEADVEQPKCYDTLNKYFEPNSQRSSTGLMFSLLNPDWCENDICLQRRERNPTDSKNDSQEYKKTPKKHGQDWLKVVELAFSLISIASLVVVLLLFFCQFNNLMNFSGKLICCMAFSLMLVNILLIVNKSLREIRQKKGHHGYHALCLANGFILHYFIISKFLWCCLFIIDLYRSVVQQKPAVANPNNPHNRRISVRPTIDRKTNFGWFAAIGFGIPLVLTGVSILVDMVFPHSKYSPGYSSEGCWQTKAGGMILFSVFPVALCLLITSMLTKMLIFRICSTIRERQQLRAGILKETTLMCVKLSLCLGIGWVLEMIGIFSDWLALKQVAALINSLQGFFMANCFLFSSRVKKSASEAVANSLIMSGLRSQFLRIAGTTSSTATSSSVGKA